MTIQKALESKNLLEAPKTEELALNLSGYLEKCWQEAKNDKRQNVEPQMLKNMRQVSGQYEDDILAAIRDAEAPEYFIMLTEAKCQAAEAWLKEVLCQPGHKPWDIEPTPSPELPPDAMKIIRQEFISRIFESIAMGTAQNGGQIDPMQVFVQVQSLIPQFEDDLRELVKTESKRRTEKLRDVIDDSLTEGAWYEAIEKFIKDVVEMPAGIIKGPIPRREPTIVIDQTADGGYKIGIAEKIIDRYERRSPWNIYPQPGSTGPQDGYLFDLISLKPKDLVALKGVPGFKDDGIDGILTDYRSGGLREWVWFDSEKLSVEERPADSIRLSGNIDCLEFWGTIQGQMLIEWGMSEKDISDPLMEYDVAIWKIGEHIIGAILNPDPLKKKPFYRVCYRDKQDCWWGNGLPQVIVDPQRACNSCVRAIIHNVGVACLTGDTVVYREGQDRKYSPITLFELWEKKKKYNNGLKRIKLRSLNADTGEFFGNKIVDVYNNGIADIYEVVTARGYRIRATGTHRFMNDLGEWQELDEFDVGSMIAINGQSVPLPPVCIDCRKPTKGNGLRCRSCAMKKNHPREATRCRKCASKITNSSWNQKQVELSKTNTDVYETTARHRFDCQSKKKNFCEVCGVRVTDDPIPHLEIHHRDRVPWNNVEDNLQTLCSPCHHSLHAKEDSFGDAYLHKYLSYDTIISIEYIGREIVYNLQMEAPYHNFVSNGFCSKNSGPQVEVNKDRLAPGESTKVWPWRTWLTTNDQMETGKAINFYAPPMVVERLIGVYNFFSKIADDHSVPGYAHGDTNVGGAGNTASGLSMLMTQAAKGIKNLIKSIDTEIIVPTIKAQFYKVIEKVKNLGMIPDFKIVAKGATALLEKEQQAIRQVEFLQMTNNPVDVSLMGQDGRRYVLQTAARNVGFEEEQVTPEKRPMLPAQNLPSQPGPATLGPDGNPAQGTDFRTFNNATNQGVNNAPAPQ
ncbi:MAG: hypothetical protein O8C67_06055 [Candidatus Methanoperedens sp.]|nr:hypothetical protein [Candidatus Methanoperedens sp.]